MGGARKEGSEAGNVTSQNQALQGGAVTSHLHGWGVGSALGGGQETRSRCHHRRWRSASTENIFGKVICLLQNKVLLVLNVCARILSMLRNVQAHCAQRGPTVESVPGRQSDGRERERACLSPFIMHFHPI